MTIDEVEVILNQLKEQINSLTESVATIQESIENIKNDMNESDNLDGLLDVNINDTLSPLTEGDILQYGANGKWTNVKVNSIVPNIQIPVVSINDLSDVVIEDLKNGDSLVYDTTYEKWTNKTITIDTESTDLSNYLKKSEAAKLYFPFSGGTITGPTQIDSYLHVTGNITSAAAITAKKSA